MKLVKVTWLDIVSDDYAGWNRRRKIKKQRPATAVSVGYLLKDKPAYVTLVATTMGEEVGGDVTIPRGCIEKIEVLGVIP